MYDLIVKNGNIVDGSGDAGYCADIGIKNGKIVAIQKTLDGAKEILDCRGLTVTPGFIDSHSHSDRTFFSVPGQKEKAEQGITTCISGQCGESRYPVRRENPTGNDLAGKYETVGAFVKKALQEPQGVYMGFLIGHGQLRKAVMGMENRRPAPEEMEEMKALLRDGMEHGARGMSFGLIYTPGGYAETDELIELAKVVGEYDGIVAAHIRNEADQLESAVEEFLQVIRAAKTRAVFSHHKAMFKQNYGKVRKTLAMIEQANREGLDIYCDVYPYTASSTSLESRFIPKEYRQGREKVVAYLKDPSIRQTIKQQNLEQWGEDLSWIQIFSCNNPAYQGKTLPQIARIHGKDQHDTALDILEDGGCGAIYFCMSDEDVDTVIGYNRSMICTDSAVVVGNANCHPRLTGSFPRALGRYVRERKVVSLEEMIRKITSLPARVYGIANKGLIREGYDADICIFDPDKIIDRADFTDCHRRAEGLNYVIVNGQIVAENAVYNGKKPATILLMKEEVSK